MTRVDKETGFLIFTFKGNDEIFRNRVSHFHLEIKMTRVDEENGFLLFTLKGNDEIFRNFADTAIQPLFENKLLKATLTDDGIHLNLEGKKIYRKALLNLINPSEKGESVSPENHPK